MDKGKSLPPSPSPPTTPSPPPRLPTIPSRPRKALGRRYDPIGRRPFGSLMGKVTCSPSSPRQRIRMRLHMEVTNLELGYGEDLVKEVLVEMLEEMRPRPLHNAFECRRGVRVLKPCENSPAFRPSPPPYEEDYCTTCLSFEDCPCPDP